MDILHENKAIFDMLGIKPVTKDSKRSELMAAERALFKARSESGLGEVEYITNKISYLIKKIELDEAGDDLVAAIGGEPMDKNEVIARHRRALAEFDAVRSATLGMKIKVTCTDGDYEFDYHNGEDVALHAVMLGPGNAARFVDVLKKRRDELRKNGSFEEREVHEKIKSLEIAIKNIL